MLCMISEQNNPYFNLAIEEYFLKNSNDEMFILYVNNPSIIVGKHQNLLSEINTSWAREHNIILARRISGGGTVYQDNGNLNFSFITNCQNLETISYKRITMPIVMTLKTLGINAEFSGRNDLLIDNRKISGNAMHIYKSRVLSHGTLLFNTDLNNLSSSLKNRMDRYIDKSIKSIPSPVANISEYLPKAMTMNQFIDIIHYETCKYLPSPSQFKLNESDKFEIDKLSLEKYSTWNWIFGYSPNYVFKNEIMLDGQSTKFQIKVESGVIKNCSLEDPDQTNEVNSFISKSLVDSRHEYQTLFELFSKYNSINLISGISVEEFCSQLF